MARGLYIPIIGDASSLLKSFKQAEDAADKFGTGLKRSTDLQVQAAVKRDARLRQEVTEYKRVAAAAEQGSREQVVAANLATQAEKRLAASLGVTAREATHMQRNLDKAGRGALAGSGAFRSLGRSMAFASGSFLGAASVTTGLKLAITAASDLAEQTSKTNVVFGRNASTIEDWSKTTTKAFGLSQRQALGVASSFGALFKPLGLIGPQAAEQSKSLTQLGADLASFYNTDVQQALDAIRSGIVGEAEPLRQYGVLLSETRVQNEALIETGKKHVGQLTNQEKALARINIIFRDTKQAQGDFDRTSQGLANQTRIAKANLDQLAATLGTQLLPLVTEATIGVNDLAGALLSLGSVKIPSIEIPFHITVGGQSVGDLLKKGFGSAVAGVPGLESAKQFVDLLKLLGVGKKQKQAPTSAELLGLPGEERPDRFGAGTAAQFRRAPRTSLQGRFNIQELKLAQAQLTARLTDDRRILIVEKAIVEQQIKQAKTLKERTDRTNTLAGIVAQIRDIDQQAADAIKQQAQARKDAAKAAADAAKAAKAAARGRLETRLQTGIDWLDFALEKADATKGIKDNIAVEKKIIAALTEQARLTGMTVDRARLIWEHRQALKDLMSQKKKAVGPTDLLKGFAGLGSVMSSGLTRQGTPLGVPIPGIWQRMTHDPSLLPGPLRPAGIVINGGIHLHGVQNVAQLENELAKRTKARPHPRRGP